VGPEDSNLWSYEIDPTTAVIALRDRARLVVAPNAPQVFNFCTIWGRFSGGSCFFSSTEEGALWMGKVGAAGTIDLIGYRRVTSPLGAALAYNRNGRLVLVAYDLHEYTTGADDGDVADVNPELLPSPGGESTGCARVG
jgi:hypothetical protein